MKKIVDMLKRGLDRVRHFALALGVALVGSAALAQDTTSATDATMEAITDGVADWLEGIVGSFKDFFVDNFTTIASVLSIAVGIAVLWAIFRLFRKGAKSAA